jgi:hypothetical protein
MISSLAIDEENIDYDISSEPQLLGVSKHNQQPQQQQQDQCLDEIPENKYKFARMMCNFVFLPCTISNFIISAPYMLPTVLFPDDPYAQDACGKLCCPLKTAFFPIFGCCIVYPTMGLASPMIDDYSSLNMFCLARCPAFIWIGCLFCHIPMDLKFMKNN